METHLTAKKEGLEAMAHLLGTLLASTYVLYTKTQNFHWNVAGPRFRSLHLLFEGQYEELAEAIDEIAERIRMLGQPAPGTLKAFLSLSQIREAQGSLTEEQMLLELYNDHEKLIEQIGIAADEAATVGDEGSVDLLAGRVRAHQKMAWMIHSHLE